MEGLDFHKFYFEGRRGPAVKAPTESPPSSAAPAGPSDRSRFTISDPSVLLLGGNAAVVSYLRVVQSFSPGTGHRTSVYEETRVWQWCKERGYVMVHFHRSKPTAAL